MRIVATVLLIAAAGMFALHAVAWTEFARVSPAVLPPAGEALEGTAPFRFAFLADSRGNLDVLEVIFERVKADNVSVILHGGDLVIEPATHDFEYLLHEIEEAELGVPFCTVAGNHDIYEEDPDPSARYRLYRRSFGPRQYWFACANALFVALDTADQTCADDDLRWLDRTLGRVRDHYEVCIVYTHCPPYDPRSHGHCLRSGAEELARILKKHRVSALFASHIHSYLEDRVEGIPVYISGGAGAGPDEPLVPYHYLLCTVEPGGAVRVERKDVGEASTAADYWEHKLLVKLPRRLGVLPMLALAVTGLLLLAVTMAPWRRRRAPDGSSAERL